MRSAPESKVEAEKNLDKRHFYSVYCNSCNTWVVGYPLPPLKTPKLAIGLCGKPYMEIGGPPEDHEADDCPECWAIADKIKCECDLILGI